MLLRGSLQAAITASLAQVDIDFKKRAEAHLHARLQAAREASITSDSSDLSELSECSDYSDLEDFSDLESEDGEDADDEFLTAILKDVATTTDSDQTMSDEDESISNEGETMSDVEDAMSIDDHAIDSDEDSGYDDSEIEHYRNSSLVLTDFSSDCANRSGNADNGLWQDELHGPFSSRERFSPMPEELEYESPSEAQSSSSSSLSALESPMATTNVISIFCDQIHEDDKFCTASAPRTIDPSLLHTSNKQIEVSWSCEEYCPDTDVPDLISVGAVGVS